MITITQKSDALLHEGIRVCNYYIEFNDLCSDGKEVWFSWVKYLEKDLLSRLDESKIVDVDGVDIFKFDRNYIDFSNLHEYIYKG